MSTGPQLECQLVDAIGCCFRVRLQQGSFLCASGNVHGNMQATLPLPYLKSAEYIPDREGTKVLLTCNVPTVVVSAASLAAWPCLSHTYCQAKANHQHLSFQSTGMRVGLESVAIPSCLPSFFSLKGSRTSFSFPIVRRLAWLCYTLGKMCTIFMKCL